MVIDNKEYKDGQRREWGEAAPGWMKWWDRIEEAAGVVSERLVELAGVGAGSHVLDVATGIGEPALTAARKAGAEGSVVATDLSPDMIEFARKRAEAEALGNVEFFDCDMETLSGEVMKDGRAFDAALCRWGLMFLPDPAAALAAIYSLLKEGGRFAGAVWSTPEKVPIASVSYNVIAKELALKPPPKGGPGIFALADTARLASLMEGAGFKGVGIETFPVTFVYDTARQYVDMTKDLAAPMRAMVAKETQERQSEVWAMVEEACDDYMRDDGKVEMVSESLLVWGTKGIAK